MIPWQKLSHSAGPWLALLLLCCGARGQTLEETQARFLEGDCAQVIKVASKRAETAYDDGWRILLVQSLLTVGRYAEARSNALAGVDDFPRSISLRLLARDASLRSGDNRGAVSQLEDIKYLIERRGRFEETPDNLVALGQALLLLGVEPRLALENCFQRAFDADPPSRDAYLAAGQLALDKHDFKLAADTYRAGLKKFTNDPDMFEGLAAAFENGDRSEMLVNLQQALAINPHHVPSLLLLADHLIDAEQYEDAEKQLDLALEVNPWRPEALADKAVLAHLKNDLAGEAQYRNKALKFWTNNPQVDCLIGKKLAQKYLFAEGAAEQRRALAFDPNYVDAQRELAEDLLRLGQVDEGWKLAEQAHHADEYDVTLYNLVTLHDQMQKFRALTNADFIVRMAPGEAALYGDRVLDLLERARAALCPKYGVTLTHPTEVEIFPEQKDFAVRTFGLPGNPGYLGVCFGSVITANSPASQEPDPANWEDVLWHEFCHVVTLTDTRNRMPRWLSEGISVYEERQANPAWGERMNLAYRQMILQGELTPLGKLSGAFLQPKNGEALQFAYYESSLAVEFLVQRFGLDSLKAILADLRDGHEINDAIASHSLPMPQLEKEFAGFVHERAAALLAGADLTKPPADEDKRKEWETSHPDNYYVRLQKARDLIEEKKWPEAESALKEIAALGESHERGENNPLWLEATAERNLGDTNAELATLQKFAQQEADFVPLDERLIEIAAARQDWAAETEYADRLLEINPLIAAPYRALARAGDATGNKDQAINACRKLLLLGAGNLAETHYHLARLLHARGDAENEAKRQVLEALEDAPRFQAAQKLLLDIDKTE